jgi:hypothetical protein
MAGMALAGMPMMPSVDHVSPATEAHHEVEEHREKQE